MNKLLITFIFILSVIAISCQAGNTTPKLPGSENNSGDTNTGESDNNNGDNNDGNSQSTNYNLYVNMGTSGNKWTTDIKNNFQTTSYNIVFQGDYITQYKDTLTYSIVSAKTADNNTDFSKYFTLAEKSTGVYGKVQLTIDQSIKDAITVGQEREVNITIQATAPDEKTATCIFISRLVRKN